MILQSLLKPNSIAVIGASENVTKPGGKAILNLLHGGYKGKLFAVNTKAVSIEGVEHFFRAEDLPATDLAILAIPANNCSHAVQILLRKGTKAFIVYTAGFGEAGLAGKALEQELVNHVERVGACLIGPNCIGIITETYKGVFTTPVPAYDPNGCELISSSGATAVFLMEAGMLNGLRFSNVYSIGNSAQTGIEEILEYMDNNFQASSPKVKLLYLENIRNPFKFMKHATSLIKKGCVIAAIKAGHSEAGQRAASSHTGALATSDLVIRALFKKTGIIYCSSRDELITVACILQSKPLRGRNLAIITHAGGSAVMLTDALVGGGLCVPPLDGPENEQLLALLNPGSSASNPIDFLATGTGEQLSEIIEYCERNEKIDGMVVVFGSPGLLNSVQDVYHRIHEKIIRCTKAIYPVLPSLINARKEITDFIAHGHVNFPDEVSLGKALPYVFDRPTPTFGMTHLAPMETATIRSLLAQFGDGYLNPAQTKEMLDAAGISMAITMVCHNAQELQIAMQRIPSPWVLKAVGPIHKTEIKGVSLNLRHPEEVYDEHQRITKIPGVVAVELQPMHTGDELYIGALREGMFGHLVLCGLGGIFLEVLNDVSHGLAPLNDEEARQMVRSLKGYKIIQGFRNKPGISEDQFVNAVVRIASLVHLAPEIAELDINPLLGNEHTLVAVDARIRIEK